MALANTLTAQPATSPQHAQAIASAQKRIDTALQNGATGPKGFLTWVKAAWPKKIADKILAAAATHQALSAQAAAAGPLGQANGIMKGGMGRAPGMGKYMGPTTFGALSPRATRGSYRLTRTSIERRREIGAFGDATTDALGSDALSPITLDTTSTDPTIANASTSGASPSWLSSIGSAVSAATQAYLGVQQSKDAQTLFNVNLQRAQQGLAPLNANPSAYGIVSPQVNVGLSSSTQTLLIAGGIGLGVILLLNVGVKAAKRS